jgi:O-antigen/teichoic acid export membrane protein
MQLSRVLKNITTTWAAVIVSAVASFLLTPFILHRLGDEAYGLWVLIIALSDYYPVLQVGVRSAVVRYVSRNLALDNHESVTRTVSTSFYFFLCLSFVVIGLAIALRHLVTNFFSIQPVNAAAFSTLFLLVGIAQAIDFPLDVFEGSLEAVGRFDQLYVLRIMGILLRVFLVIVALEKGGGLLSVGAATVFSTLMLRCVAVPLAYREVAGFRLHPRGIDRKTFIGMLKYGFTSFSIGLGERLKLSLYPAVIAKVLSASAVTLFSLPTKLLNIPLNGIGSMTEFVSPLSSQLEAQQNKAGLRRLALLCGEISILLFAPLAVLMLVFGSQLLRLWAGSSYVTAYPLLVLLTVGLGVYAIQLPVRSLLFGIGRHQGLIWMRCAEALGTAALGVMFMKIWGVWGYAFATMMVSLAINLFLIPRYACRELEMPLSNYWVSALLKPCLFSLPLAGSLVVFEHVLPVEPWIDVIGATLFGGGVYLLTLVGSSVLKRQERVSWPSLGVLDLLEKRYLEGKAGANLYFAEIVSRASENSELPSVED